jgi:hypothetical protein
VHGRQFLPAAGGAVFTKAAKQGFFAGAIFALAKAMPAYDFNMNKAGFAALQAASASSAAPAATKSSGFSLHTAFHDLLEIVNPLQHLPIVGTLYRAITHDTIGTVEKIAGDALYGGMWGAVGSVADVAFEAATGKDFGATVLALITGIGDKPTAVATTTPPAPANKPPAQASTQVKGADVAALITAIGNKPAAVATTAPPAPASNPAAQASTQVQGADVVALSNSLTAKGVDSALSARALFAYQQSQSLGANPKPSSLVAVN